MAIDKHSNPFARLRAGKVGNTADAASLMMETFDLDIDKIGQLTPSGVRQLSLMAQKGKDQVMYGKVAVRQFESIMDSIKKLEEMRVELLKAGMKNTHEIDKAIAKLSIEVEKHRDASQTLATKTQGAVRELHHKGSLTREEYNIGLADKLRLQLRESQNKVLVSAQQRQTDSDLKLRLGEQNRRESQREARFNQKLVGYMKGEGGGKWWDSVKGVWDRATGGGAFA